MNKQPIMDKSNEIIISNTCLIILKASTAIFLVVSLIMLSGCEQSKEKLLAEMNTIYLDVRTVITDPLVLPLIPEDKLSILQEAEKKYLDAVAILKTIDSEDTTDKKAKLRTIIECADTILSVLDSLPISSSHKLELAAARVSINILKNHLSS